MTQRKFVFMKFEDSLFLHFSEFFGEGAPVEVQIVGEAWRSKGIVKVSAPVLADCAAR